MCTVAVKYLKGYGWVGAKNRDRNYVVGVNIVKSSRGGIQRIYIDDNTTRWTEGLNEYGVAILSASLSVKSDEKEADKVGSSKNSPGKRNPIVSRDGLAIRKALMFSDPKKAAQSLIDSNLAGATYIFNKDVCYMLEGGFTVKKENATDTNPREYKHVLKEIAKDDSHSVRTNHGIDLTYLGYSKNSVDPKTKRNRASSESRWDIVNSAFKKSNILTPTDFLECLSLKPNGDAFMNPIRLGDPKKGEMVTTGQLLLVPSDCTLHYRPIYSNVFFDYPGINGKESTKVYFEIISSRKLLSFQKFIDKK